MKLSTPALPGPGRPTFACEAGFDPKARPKRIVPGAAERGHR